MRSVWTTSECWRPTNLCRTAGMIWRGSIASIGHDLCGRNCSDLFGFAILNYVITCHFRGHPYLYLYCTCIVQNKLSARMPNIFTLPLTLLALLLSLLSPTQASYDTYSYLKGTTYSNGSALVTTGLAHLAFTSNLAFMAIVQTASPSLV